MALAKSGISKLIIHTVGFGVDDTTRGQLECIARVSGGRYFSASSANEHCSNNHAASSSIGIFKSSIGTHCRLLVCYFINILAPVNATKMDDPATNWFLS